MCNHEDRGPGKPHVPSRRQWTLGSVPRSVLAVCALLLCAALETAGTAAPPVIPSPDQVFTRDTNVSPANVLRPPKSTVTTRLDIPDVVPLTKRTLLIAGPARNLPPNVAADFFDKVEARDHGIRTRRSWTPSGFTWQASALHYHPLYFQDVHLERYGMSFGIAQPAISTAHAFGQFLALPAMMILHHPFQRTYPLGY